MRSGRVEPISRNIMINFKEHYLADLSAFDQVRILYNLHRDTDTVLEGIIMRTNTLRFDDVLQRNVFDRGLNPAPEGTRVTSFPKPQPVAQHVQAIVPSTSYA